MKVGDKIWHFDINRRIYRRTEDGITFGPPIYREHWYQVEITGETSRSWLVGWGKDWTRVPKKGPHPGFAFTQQEVEDDVWLHDYRDEVAREVRRINNPSVLREVAKLIGFEG